MHHRMNALACCVFGTAALVCACSSSNSGPDVPTAEMHSSQTHPANFTSKLLVANNGSILSFGLPSVGGNVAPTQDISGSNTRLAHFERIAVGPNEGNIYSAGPLNPYVSVYLKDANGNAYPYYSLNTNHDPGGLTVTTAGNLWVGDLLGYILEYAPLAKGNAAPINVIYGSNTELGGTVSLAFDSKQRLYVASFHQGNILIFAAGASGNVAPVANISGPQTKLQDPVQIAFDNSTYGKGRLLVADDFARAVLVFAPNASGNVAPVAAITRVSNPEGVATDASGNIFVSANQEGAIYEFGPNANGYAEPLITITGANTELYLPQQLAVGSY